MSWYDGAFDKVTEWGGDIADGVGDIFDYRLDQEVDGIISAEESVNNTTSALPGGSGQVPVSQGVNWQVIGVGIAAVGLLITVMRVK